jgi:hypothetical protein
MKKTTYIWMAVAVVVIYQFTFLAMHSFMAVAPRHEQRMFVPNDANTSQHRMEIINDRQYNNLLYSKISQYMTLKGTDGEAIDAAEHFFWGMKNGIVLELGAYDGRMHSQSLFYEEVLGWQRILVEGNPQLGHKLHLLNPRAVSFNMAICNEAGILHWAGGNNGILEFLPKPLLTGVMNGALYKAAVDSNCVMSNGVIDWSKFDFTNFPTISEIGCMPLSSIFETTGVTHINFFVLDVEGGEYSILKTIDWGRIRFDVIVVETEVGTDGDNITSLLRSHRYNKEILIGRNTWYRHTDFTPMSRSMRPKDLYLGYLLSQNSWRVFPKRFIDGNGYEGGDPILTSSRSSCHSQILCNKSNTLRNISDKKMTNSEMSRSSNKWQQ